MRILPIGLGFIAGAALSAALGWYAWQQQSPAAKHATAADNVTVLPALNMAGLDRSRPLRIYLPPGYGSSDERYPVLYMHDGQNLFDDATSYVGEWGVDEALNTLAQTHGLKLIVVGIDHGDQHRMTELNPLDNARFGKAEGDAYLDFLVQQVKPLIDRDYRTLPGQPHTAIMGSSMGGLISHYALLRHPDIFSKAGIFSPAYWTAEGFQTLAAAHQGKQSQRLFFLMGEAEGGDMMRDFRAMEAALPALASQARLFVSVPHARHNEAFWRSQLVPALLWLFADRLTPTTATAAAAGQNAIPH